MKRMIDEPLRGTIGDVSSLRLSGLDAMRRAVRRQAPPPPMHHLTGLTPTEAGLGTMTFTLPVTRWLEDSVGVIWGGVYALLADAPISTALYTGLAPGKFVSTSELSINYLRPANTGSGNLIGRGRSVYLGREVGVSEATIEDSRGRTMAHATTRCVIRDLPFDPDSELMSPPPPIDDPPDPYLREPPPEATLDLSIWDGDRLETQRKLTDGSLPPSPIALLTGLELLSAEPGRATGSIPASPWFSVGQPVMYGGVIAWACDVGLTGAVWSTLDPDAVAANLDLQVRFLRPVPLDGRPLTLEGRVVHEGRSMRVSHAEITDADGKRVAIASGSSLVIPGGMDLLMAGRGPEEIVASVER